VEYLYVNFGDPSCIGFRDIMRKIRDTQTNGGEDRTPATAVGVGNQSVEMLH